MYVFMNKEEKKYHFLFGKSVLSGAIFGGKQLYLSCQLNKLWFAQTPNFDTVPKFF